MIADPRALIIILDAARRDTAEPLLANSRVGAFSAGASPTLIAPSCWTVPSVASLLTGLFPSEHGRRWPLDNLPPWPPSLIDFLTQAGRRALVVSANEMYSPPVFDLGEQEAIFPLQRYPRASVGLRRTLGLLDYGGRGVLETVQRLIAEDGVPDLLIVHLNEAHHPYLPPPDGSFSRWVTCCVGHLGYYLTRRAQVWESAARATPAAWVEARRRYTTCLAYNVGLAEQIVEAYEAAGLLDNALILLTADHGEHLGEHGLADHQASLYEELVHVPCRLWAPGMPAGTRTEGQFQHTDIAFTVAGYLGVGLDGYQPGRQPLDMLDEANWETGHEHAFMEWRAWGQANLAKLQRRNPSYDFGPLNRDLSGVRTKEWKLIVGSDGTRRLFSLTDDPGEERDLAGERPETVAELGERLGEWQGAVGGRPGGGDDLSEADRELVEQRLADLGYL